MGRSFKNTKAWNKFYEGLIKRLKEAELRDREEILKKALKKIDYESGGYLLVHLYKNKEFNVELGKKFIKDEKWGLGYIPRTSLEKFKENINNYSLKEQSRLLGHYYVGVKYVRIEDPDNLDPKRRYYDVKIKKRLNEVLFVYYLQKYFDKFFKELNEMIKVTQEFFKGQVAIEGYGITNNKSVAFYNEKNIYFSPKFLARYARYLTTKNKKLKERLKDIILNIIAHELAHDVSFKIQEVIKEYYKKCNKELTKFTSVCFGTKLNDRGFPLYRIIDDLDEYQQGAHKSNIWYRPRTLVKHINERIKPEEFKKKLEGFQKNDKIKFTDEEQKFLVKLPYKLAEYIQNLHFLYKMITEFPAMAIGFLYTLYYYRKELKNDKKVFEKIKRVNKIEAEELPELYREHLKTTFGAPYRWYGKLRYKQLKDYFNKYGMEQLDDVALFMKEVNNLEDISGLKRQWNSYKKELVRIIKKYNLVYDSQKYSWEGHVKKLNI